MPWSERLGRTLDWSPMKKAMLMLALMIPLYLQCYGWCQFVRFFPNPFINQEMTVVTSYYTLVCLMLIFILLSAGYGLRHNRVVVRFAPLISVEFFTITMSFLGYLMGLFSIAVGVMIMGFPIVGLILFERKIIYAAVTTALSLFFVITILTAQGILPYSPVIDARRVVETGSHLYMAATICYFSMPFFIIILMFSDSLISRWREREEQVRQLGLTDSLTGLANRRAIIAHLSKCLNEREGLLKEIPAAIIMLDLDHFKHINDSYGHTVGDVVLKVVSVTLKQCLRLGDEVGRIGGEEFLVVLHQATWEEAWQVAKRCREALLALKLAHIDESLLITASFGVCSNEGMLHMAAEEMMFNADVAMYHAKAMGRNRVLTSCENVRLDFELDFL